MYICASKGIFYKEAILELVNFMRKSTKHDAMSKNVSGMSTHVRRSAFYECFTLLWSWGHWDNITCIMLSNFYYSDRLRSKAAYCSLHCSRHRDRNIFCIICIGARRTNPYASKFQLQPSWRNISVCGGIHLSGFCRKVLLSLIWWCSDSILHKTRQSRNASSL